MLCALYTRHHDRRVRERFVQQVLTSTEPWLAPYVELLGSRSTNTDLSQASQLSGGLPAPPLIRHWKVSGIPRDHAMIGGAEEANATLPQISAMSEGCVVSAVTSIVM
jgi:hypothetical protein